MDQKRTWLYCCVVDNGSDCDEMLASQLYHLENYAKEHGFEIVGSSRDIGSGLTFDRPGLLDFHRAAENGNVDILLISKLSRLGRDMDKIIKYWHQLHNLGVGIHATDCGEIDLSVNAMLRGMIGEIRKRSR